jgi:hypothetical protein
MFFHEHATAPAHRLSPREDARVVRVHLPINPREHSRYRRAPPGQQRPCPWAQFQVVPSKRRERLIKNGREMDEITRHDAHVARKRRSGPNKVAMGEKRPHLTYQAKFHRIVSLDENLAADHVANNHPMGNETGASNASLYGKFGHCHSGFIEQDGTPDQGEGQGTDLIGRSSDTKSSMLAETNRRNVRRRRGPSSSPSAALGRVGLVVSSSSYHRHLRRADPSCLWDASADLVLLSGRGIGGRRPTGCATTIGGSSPEGGNARGLDVATRRSEGYIVGENLCRRFSLSFVV